jgi:hypothetical protein
MGQIDDPQHVLHDSTIFHLSEWLMATSGLHEAPQVSPAGHSRGKETPCNRRFLMPDSTCLHGGTYTARHYISFKFTFTLR